MNTGTNPIEYVPLWRDYLQLNTPWIATPTHAGKWWAKDPANDQTFNAYVREENGNLEARIVSVNTEYKSVSELARYGWVLWKALEI